MSFLQNVEAAKDVVVEIEDRLGGSKFGPWETNVYDCKITMMYQIESAKGAVGIVTHYENSEGKELVDTTYVTNRQKGTTYVCKKTGKNKYLPGYQDMDTLTQMTVGKGLLSVPTEEKTLNLWNRDLKKETPTNVPVMSECIGKTIKIAVYKQIEDKNVDDGNGKWVPGGETRETNEIVKFFHGETGLTMAEALAGENQEGVFVKDWAEQHAGKVRNLATGVADSGAKPSGAFGGGTPAAQKPAGSIFAAAAG